MSTAISSLKHIQAITFDVHNVLLTIRDGAASQYARLARQHLGIESIDESQLRSDFVKAFRTCNSTHPGYGIHDKNMTSRQWWTMFIGQTFERYHWSSQQIEYLSKNIFDEFAKGDMWIKHPQADRILKQLEHKTLGIISNFDERLESLLEQHNLRQYFKFILTPRNCCLYKPQTDIFEFAVTTAHLKSNSNLCHVGDDVKLDYRAAQAAHCHALLLAKNEETKQTLLHDNKDIREEHIITQLDDLLHIFS